MSFEPLYTADEMKDAEAGHDVAELMERAGRAVAEHTLEWFPDAQSFTVVCGGGANGGDGRIAARLLQEAGWSVRVVDAKEGGELGDPDVVVDAIFGTGFSGEPTPEAAVLIEAINESEAEIVAVDVPSGVDASTGEVPGAAVRADLTVTFHGEKVGLHVAPGSFYAGAIEPADIGLDSAETAHARVTREILELVPRRMPGDNKHSSGSVLVVGGSPGLTGAVCLAAEAAFRADAGYVAVAVPRESLPVVEVRLLEAVKRPIDAVDELAKRAGALALGPGLGRGEEQRALVRRLLAELELPAVVDADGLWELEAFEREAPTVLTPHEGELARLLGEESAWVAAHRLEALRRAVDRFACVVVLKGSGTLVGAPGEGVLVCGGFPTLATAGTGDVLTGIVASFLAKGMEARIAAAAAVTAQWAAAIEAPQKTGLIASDLIAALPRALG